MATYLITGAAGFIGSHLAHALLSRGEQVRGLDNLVTGKQSNLAKVADRIDLRVADLRDPGAVASACKGVDYILHQAGLPSVSRSVLDPGPSHTSNIDGTFNLLEAARAAGVRRIIYAASSSAYGNQPGFPRVETMPTSPVSPYAVQKLTGELYMRSYWEVYGLETVCLRYFNIFGPRQDPNSVYAGVIARFALEMLRGERPTIFGDGEQCRDFTYIDNVVQANLSALAAPAGQVAGKVFNIACGERHSLTETFYKLARLLDFNQEPLYRETRIGDVRDSLADILAARNAFGYGNLVSFDEGLRRSAEWYRSATPLSGV